MAPALKLAREILTPEEERGLITLIEASGLKQFAYDPDNPRSSASFGWKYDFLSDSFKPCPPMPAGFARVAAVAAGFAGVAVEDFAECLLNRYDPGAIIQPHLDKPCWEHVIGISLGSSAVMEFRRATDAGWETAPIVLPARSMYILEGETRHVWQHSLPPLRERRWSITFRTFSVEGLRQLEAAVPLT